MTSALPKLSIVSDNIPLLAPWPKLYFICIYNTDDALTQGKWSEFQQDVHHMVCSEDTALIHGVWYTPSAIPYQSMAIGFNLTGDFPEMVIREFKSFLKGLSEENTGCTIQWSESEVVYI